MANQTLVDVPLRRSSEKLPILFLDTDGFFFCGGRGFFIDIFASKRIIKERKTMPFH